MRNNVTQFPLNKEDIMRLKPEDICGRVWKESKYGTVADIDCPNDNNERALKVVSSRTQPAKTTTEERKNMVAPKIIEKIDDYIEDTAEKVWNILKGLFKND